MAFALLCDRCGHPYTCHQLVALCLRCAVGADAAQHRGDWARPLTYQELVAAAAAARNHTRRRPHLGYKELARWWWPT